MNAIDIEALQKSYDLLGKAYEAQKQQHIAATAAKDAEIRQLTYRLQAAGQQLVYLWEKTHSCPCGARRGSEHTHSHVTGCPTGLAVQESEALEAAKGGAE